MKDYSVSSRVFRGVVKCLETSQGAALAARTKLVLDEAQRGEGGQKHQLIVVGPGRASASEHRVNLAGHWLVVVVNDLLTAVNSGTD